MVKKIRPKRLFLDPNDDAIILEYFVENDNSGTDIQVNIFNDTEVYLSCLQKIESTIQISIPYSPRQQERSKRSM